MKKRSTVIKKEIRAETNRREFRGDPPGFELAARTDENIRLKELIIWSGAFKQMIKCWNTIFLYLKNIWVKYFNKIVEL